MKKILLLLLFTTTINQTSFILCMQQPQIEEVRRIDRCCATAAQSRAACLGLCAISAALLASNILYGTNTNLLNCVILLQAYILLLKAIFQQRRVIQR